MRVVFCCDPLDHNRVDVDYKSEYEVALKMNLKVELISFEELIENNNPIKSVKRITFADNPETAIYRGWMLKPKYYSQLFIALKEKQINLINTPEQYEFCHYLPTSYDLIKEHTPKTIWLYKDEYEGNVEELHIRLSVFGNKPLIVKDFVKSRKHEWEDACYIPDASKKEKVACVVSNFVSRQGEDLNEGIVLREFVNLEFLSYHPKSNMPLSKEFRVFFLNHEPAIVLKYWDEGEYESSKPDLSSFLSLVKEVKSNFFTMDIAKLETGEWIIVELGDGQVSGLPDNADMNAFYEKISELKFY